MNWLSLGVFAIVLLTGWVPPCVAAPRRLDSGQEIQSRLVWIRKSIGEIEQSLVEGSKSRKSAQAQAKKIATLIRLQREEQKMGKRRLEHLEQTVKDLVERKKLLTSQVSQHQEQIRKLLSGLELAAKEPVGRHLRSVRLPEEEIIEAPRRKVLYRLADRGLREVEVLKTDLADAVQLESRIDQEKQQLNYLLQDLKEQEGVLDLSHQLQIDFIRKKQTEHLGQLENYRKLKSAEFEVEHLMQTLSHRFNPKSELKAEVETDSLFAHLKGRLPLPVENGKIIKGFGRTFEASTGLNVFKKGIEIEAVSGKEVRAVSAGRVAFAGKMPEYGQVVIIDHGNHFYSLCARLGVLHKKTQDRVNALETIGETERPGAPLYFEIRSKNVAVNPLLWLAKE